MGTDIATKKVITVTAATAAAATICIAGPWIATPAQATTDASGGAPTTSRLVEVGEIVALRKMQMAHDYVVSALARAGRTTDGR